MAEKNKAAQEMQKLSAKARREKHGSAEAYRAEMQRIARLPRKKKNGIMQASDTTEADEHKM